MRCSLRDSGVVLTLRNAVYIVLRDHHLFDILTLIIRVPFFPIEGGI
jgi:hypothetical protein